MGDTITMKRAIKFAQKYMEKAELPLTAADLTHAFFAGKDFGLSRAWNKVEDSSPSHESANEQIAVCSRWLATPTTSESSKSRTTTPSSALARTPSSPFTGPISVRCSKTN